MAHRKQRAYKGSNPIIALGLVLRMFSAERIAYRQTGAFTTIVTDYLDGADALTPFYSQPPDLAGIRRKLEERKQFSINRNLLVQTLTDQYMGLSMHPAVGENIQRLLHANTFTVCTAHQPNLFTGPLYFMYKLLHAIKLAEFLTKEIAGYAFVPVYYMGSEDADFAELAHTYIDGKRLEWKREQSGAVGRMLVDKTLVQLIDELEGQLGVEAHGAEVIGLLRTAYTQGKTIQQATFELLNELYGSHGLVILLPDNPVLKAQARSIFEDDLFRHTPYSIVQETSARLSADYKAQAYPRPINLFYLKDDVRERIEEEGGSFQVLNTEIRFTADELKKELENHPERFSPNVVLRGLYQEILLPNIAFVGGGGELAYWLQLKDLFTHYGVPYPVLVLRNSFLVVEEKWQQRLRKLGLPVQSYFQPGDDLVNEYVRQHTQNELTLTAEQAAIVTLCDALMEKAASVDKSLLKHIAAVNTRMQKAIDGVERKLLRAEKRKFAAEQAQLQTIREALFPAGSLQERKENFSRFYAKWGKEFIDALYEASMNLEQEFTVLKER